MAVTPAKKITASEFNSKMESIGVNLRVTAHSSQGGRKYMEDMFCVAYQPTSDGKDLLYAYFGIFDGHGGKEAALYAKQHLMDNIVSQDEFWSEDDQLVLKAIKNGFIKTHYAMWNDYENWPRTPSGLPSTSGTTASIGFVRRGKMYIGHVGDSGITLGYQEPGQGYWRAEQLTKDHKPDTEAELQRITEAGGKVINKSGVPRVVWNRPRVGHQGPIRRSTSMDEIPFLAVARSLGDLWSYNSEKNKFVVSPEPDVFIEEIDVTKHRCFILGSDGLSNMMNPQDAVNSVYFAEKNNERQLLASPQNTPTNEVRNWINPSRRLVDRALERWEQNNLRADNTSVVTVVIDPPGPPKAQVLRQHLKKGFLIRHSKDEAPGRSPVSPTPIAIAADLPIPVDDPMPLAEPIPAGDRTPPAVLAEHVDAPITPPKRADGLPVDGDFNNRRVYRKQRPKVRRPPTPGLPQGAIPPRTSGSTAMSVSPISSGSRDPAPTAHSQASETADCSSDTRAPSEQPDNTNGIYYTRGYSDIPPPSQYETPPEMNEPILKPVRNHECTNPTGITAYNRVIPEGNRIPKAPSRRKLFHEPSDLFPQAGPSSRTRKRTAELASSGSEAHASKRLSSATDSPSDVNYLPLLEFTPTPTRNDMETRWQGDSSAAGPVASTPDMNEVVGHENQGEGSRQPTHGGETSRSKIAGVERPRLVRSSAAAALEPAPTTPLRKKIPPRKISQVTTNSPVGITRASLRVNPMRAMIFTADDHYYYSTPGRTRCWSEVVAFRKGFGIPVSGQPQMDTPRAKRRLSGKPAGSVRKKSIGNKRSSAQRPVSVLRVQKVPAGSIKLPGKKRSLPPSKIGAGPNEVTRTRRNCPPAAKEPTRRASGVSTKSMKSLNAKSTNGKKRTPATGSKRTAASVKSNRIETGNQPASSGTAFRRPSPAGAKVPCKSKKSLDAKLQKGGPETPVLRLRGAPPNSKPLPKPRRC